jgi:hypothetical protein
LVSAQETENAATRTSTRTNITAFIYLFISPCMTRPATGHTPP